MNPSPSLLEKDEATLPRSWHVYILRCADATLYTGVTTELERRLEIHNESPRGAKYVRGRRPAVLVYSRPMPNKSAALKEESRIKKLKRTDKLKLRAS